MTIKSSLLAASIMLAVNFSGCAPAHADTYLDDDDIGLRTLKALKITSVRMNRQPQNCISEERRYELVRNWKFDLIHVFNGGHGQVWQSQVSGNIMFTFEFDGTSCVIGTGKSQL